MDNFMNAVDLPRSAVRNLFELLDEDGDHVINVGEFVDGCLRLKGAPRAVDVSQLLSEHRQLAKKQKEWFMAIIRHIERSHAEVQQVTQLAQTGQLWEVKPSLATTIEDV
jgi:tRNA A37 N6-isopentenylltransferase MiaA